MEEYDPFAGMTDKAKKVEPEKEKASSSGVSEPTPEVVEPEKEKVTPEKKAPAKRTNTMASNGKPVGAELPPPSPFPSWPGTPNDDVFIPDEEIDFTDLSDLNREINRARSRSFRIKNALTDARRQETESQEVYRRAYNRALVSISGGSAETRKAMAEIKNEELYSTVLISQTVVKELTNLSYTVSRDLDTLKTISDNLRKQLSI